MNWIFSLQKSISKLIFAGYTGSKNQVRNRTDQLIIQKQKLDFSITKPCRYQFEALVFNQERLLYCT